MKNLLHVKTGPSSLKQMPHYGGMKVMIRNCPCCGEHITLRETKGKIVGIYYGPQGMGNMGVQCYTCGLKMVVDAPDNWPKGVKCGDLKALDKYTLAEAIKKWNRRS